MSYNYAFKKTVPASIFIGLGGVGGRILEGLHKRLYKIKLWQEVSASSTGFLAIDTNIEDLADLRNLTNVNTFHTARTDRSARLEAIKEEDQFLPRFTKENYTPRSSGKGAGQIRMESRVGFYAYSDLLQEELKGIVRRITDVDNPFLRQDARIDIFIMGSISGGTGSGCFLPMAYLTRDVMKQLGYEATIHAHLVTSTSLTSRQQALTDFVHANTYAALKELEALSKLNAKGETQQEPIEFVYRRPRSAQEGPTLVNHPPFDWINIADMPNRDIELEQIEGIMSDALFASQMTIPIRQANEGALDNYTRFVSALYKNQKVKSLSQSTEHFFSHAYGSQGVAALICPDESLKEYYHKLAKSEVVRHFLSDAKESKINFDEFDLTPSQRLKLEAQQWLNAVDEAIHIEKRETKEKIELLEANGITAPEDFKGGIWTSIRNDVFGETTQEAVGNLGPNDKNNQSTPLVSGNLTINDILFNKIKERITIALEKIASAQISSNINQGIGATCNSFEEKTTAKQAVYQKAKAELIRYIKNDLLGDLSLDPQREKFLIYSLLFSKDPQVLIDQKIKKPENTISSPQSLRDRLQEKIKNHEKNERTLWQIINREPGAKVWKNEDNTKKELNLFIKQVQNEINNNLEYEVYSTLKETLMTRAKTYSAISKAANRSAYETIQDANAMLNEPLEPQETYTLEVEALEPIEGKRLWREYWDDKICSPFFKEKLLDQERIGKLIQDILKQEESRARRRRESTPNAYRIVKTLNQKIDDHVTSTLSDVFTGINLAAALEWEAHFQVKRNSKENEISTKEALNSKIDFYIKAKIDEFLSKSFSLCNLNAVHMEQRSVVDYSAQLLLIAPEVKAALSKYPETMKLLSDSNLRVLDGEGHVLDPMSLVCFSIVYAIPIYAFNSIDNFHDAYYRIMKSENKPHELHSQSNWEKSLPDLSILALQNELKKQQTTKLKDLLFDCIRYGLVIDDKELGWLLKREGLNDLIITTHDDQIVHEGIKVMEMYQDDIRFIIKQKGTLVDDEAIKISYQTLRCALDELKRENEQISNDLQELYQRLRETVHAPA